MECNDTLSPASFYTNACHHRILPTVILTVDCIAHGAGEIVTRQITRVHCARALIKLGEESEGLTASACIRDGYSGIDEIDL